MSGDQESAMEQLREEKAREKEAREKAEEREKNLEEDLKKVRESSEEELRKMRAELDANKAELRKLSPGKSDYVAEGSFTWDLQNCDEQYGETFSPYTIIGDLSFRIGYEHAWNHGYYAQFRLLCNDDSTSSKTYSAKVTGTLIVECDESPWCDPFSAIFNPEANGFKCNPCGYNQYIKNDRFTMQVHIKVIYHYKNGITDFASPDPNLTDVTLIVDGMRINASKTYLANHSEYFKVLFFSDFAEKTKKEITLDDIKADEFEEMLRVIYPERKKITADNVPILLRMADFFDVHSLVRACTDFLVETSKLTLAAKLRFTEEFRLPELRDSLIEGMANWMDLKNLIKSKDFGILSEGLQKSLLEKHFKLTN